MRLIGWFKKNSPSTTSTAAVFIKPQEDCGCTVGSYATRCGLSLIYVSLAGGGGVVYLFMLPACFKTPSAPRLCSTPY
jgi:hypothetical protein